MELSVFSLVYLLHAVNISRHRYPDRTFSSNVNIREVYYDSKQGHFLSPGFPVRDGCEITALSHVASSLHSNRVGLDRVNVPCVFSELRICCGDLGNMRVWVVKVFREL